MRKQIAQRAPGPRPPVERRPAGPRVTSTEMLRQVEHDDGDVHCGHDDYGEQLGLGCEARRGTGQGDGDDRPSGGALDVVSEPGEDLPLARASVLPAG